MRAFLIAMLCLMLVLQPASFARMLGEQEACPMASQQSAVQPCEEAGDRHDCCHDAATAAQAGQLCKAGSPCALSSLFVVPSFRAHIPSPQGSTPAPALTAPIAWVYPADIWRPPTLG